MKGEAVNIFQGKEVFPKSLFEAQLDYRLNPEKYITLSSEDLEFSNEIIHLFPNPFSGEINLRSDELIDLISLVDSKGREMKITLQKADKSLIIKPSNLSDGIHFLKVTIGETEKVFRVLKKK